MTATHSPAGYPGPLRPAPQSQALLPLEPVAPTASGSLPGEAGPPLPLAEGNRSRPGQALRLTAVEDHVSEETLRRGVGRRLRASRMMLDVSQEEVAQAAGTTRNFVSAIERGAQGLDGYRLGRIAGALGVSLTALLTGEDFDRWVDTVLGR